MRHSQVSNFTLFRVAPHFHLLLPSIDDDDGWHCCFRIIIFSVDSASAPLFSRISREYKLILTFYCVVFCCLLLLLLKWHNSTSKQICRLFHSSKHFSLAERKSSKSSKFSHFLAVVFSASFSSYAHTRKVTARLHMSFRAQKKRITFVLFFLFSRLIRYMEQQKSEHPGEKQVKWEFHSIFSISEQPCHIKMWINWIEMILFERFPRSSLSFAFLFSFISSTRTFTWAGWSGVLECKQHMKREKEAEWRL